MKAHIARGSHFGAIGLGSVMALAAVLIAAWTIIAAKPQPVTATGIYLMVDFGQASITPSGRVHSTGLQALAIVDSDNPLFQGRLMWWGEANTDTAYNGVCHGAGIIELGVWDDSQVDPDTGGPVFIPTGGQWNTKFEVVGNFLTGPYEGQVNSHGVSGPVAGMNAVLPFTGGWGLDYYTGQYVVPGK